MSDPDRRDIPPGPAGEGQEDYPTYHDRPGDAPAPVEERKRRGTPWVPIFIGVVIFAIVLIVRLVWSGAETIESAGEAPDTSPATELSEPAGEMSLDRDVEIETETGPGTVGDEPGAIDVPGGDVTEPVETPQNEVLPGAQ